MQGRYFLAGAVGMVGALFGDFDLDEAEAQTTNSWISVGDGFWESTVNWSLGRIPTNTDSVFFTNALTKIAIIRAQTTNTTSMVISNLAVAAPTGATNTVPLTKAGTNVPFRIRNVLTLTAGGAMEISNGLVQVENLAGITSFPIKDDGAILLNSPSARLVCTSQTVAIGSSAPGTLTISNGTLVATSENIGQAVGSNGTLTMAGGTNQFDGLTIIGGGGSGTVWVTGGTILAVPSTAIRVSANAPGQMIVSNGTVSAVILDVGVTSGSSGTLTIAGGTNVLTSSLIVGDSGSSTGRVWMKGGQLALTNTVVSGTLTVGSSGSGNMTVSNGTILANFLEVAKFGTSHATLTMVGGQLNMTNQASTSFIVGGGGVGTLTFSGGTGDVRLVQIGATGGTATGTLWMTGGQLNVSSLMRIGAIGTGVMIVSNGVVLATNVTVASGDGRGTLAVANTGKMAMTGPLVAGSSLGGTGAVLVTGGQLVVTNNPASVGAGAGFVIDGTVTITNGSSIIVSNVNTFIGNRGSGSLTVRGGIVQAVGVQLGANAGSQGALTLAGGTLSTSCQLVIGAFGVGQMTVSNGTVLLRDVMLGSTGGRGTWTIAGGTNSVYANVLLGELDCFGTGIVMVAGGRLFVPNSAATAVCDIRSGTLEFDSGTLTIDKLVITNACGRFVHTAGALSITTTNVSGGLDADGDGIPNAFALDPFDPADASNDPDGDGFSNLQEFLLGTDPTSSASFFGITAITKESNDIRVTWMTGSGKTNALDRSAGDPSGNFTTNYVAIFTVTNTVGTATNYLDVGAATNFPARYYRVRLVP